MGSKVVRRRCGISSRWKYDRRERRSLEAKQNEERRGERNADAASCQFYGSLWWLELSSFGRSEGREGIAATDSGDNSGR